MDPRSCKQEPAQRLKLKPELILNMFMQIRPVERVVRAIADVPGFVSTRCFLLACKANTDC